MKHYDPNIRLPLKVVKFAKSHNSRNNFKMPKFAKGHNSNKFLQNLLNIYQLTKIQAPSSNSFRDILLTSVKCLILQRAIMLEKGNRISSKVNKVICLSSPISWPKFKPLAQILFQVSCWQDFNVFLKGHKLTPERGITRIRKKYGPASHYFLEESIYKISKP